MRLPPLLPASLAALLVPWAAGAQAAGHPLAGRWTGAFVRGGAAESVVAEVTAQGDSALLALSLPDRPTAATTRAVVRAAPGGGYRFPTPHGPATVALDTVVQEVVGVVGADSLGLRLHLRRALPPAPYAAARDTLTFRSGNVPLRAVLFRPVGVRRPRRRDRRHGARLREPAGFEPLAELLARHGTAAFVYDKRGADPAARPCATATVADFAGDVAAAAAQLATRDDVDPRRIGAIGWSAGGRAVTAASARAPLAFLALLVGPSTSVAEQQLGSIRVFAHGLRLSAADSAAAVRYVTLMVTPGNRAARFAEMRRLLEDGRRAGWAQAWLETDDVPNSEAGADSLWAIRNAYDPAADLRRFRGPVLGVYGGVDDVVPPEQNAALLRELARAGGNARATAVIVPVAGHGLAHPGGRRSVTLGDGRALDYWKFPRPAPQYLAALLDFLRREGIAGEPR